VVLGVGLSIVVPALTTVALNSVDARNEGLASAINNAFSQTAGLLAVAVLGVIMFASFGGSLDDRLAALNLPPDARQQLKEEKAKLGAAQAPGGLDAAQSANVDRAIVGGVRLGLPGGYAGRRGDGASQRCQRRAPDRGQETKGER
jgi:hypothetical protein